jgi:hypothetical protein
MEVFQREKDLRGVEFRLTKRELLALNMKHEISSANVLHHKIYTRLCLEARMQSKKEGVSLASCGKEDSLFGTSATHSFIRIALIKSKSAYLSTSSLSMMNSFFKTLIA